MYYILDNLFVLCYNVYTDMVEVSADYGPEASLLQTKGELEYGKKRFFYI